VIGSGLLTLALISFAPARPAAPELPISIPGHYCDPLPVGELTDAQLRELVPDGSPGKVRIRWTIESQDNVFGFNVMRAESESGPFIKVNRSIIPGEGTTNMPKAYCYLDTQVERGKTYWYYVEEVTLDGQRTAIEGTKGPDGKGTKVTVRHVEAEREWLRNRARQLAQSATLDQSTTAPTTTSDKPTTR
jgi:hypothetical protein